MWSFTNMDGLVKVLIAMYDGKYPKSWHVGTELASKFPEQPCEIQADGDELEYVLQFIPHEKITLREVKFYGFEAFRIVCGINEDYYKRDRVQRYECL